MVFLEPEAMSRLHSIRCGWDGQELSNANCRIDAAIYWWLSVCMMSAAFGNAKYILMYTQVGIILHVG